MTNNTKMVDGVIVPLTDAEQTAFNAANAAYVAALPARLLAALAAHRYAIQTGGTTVSGVPFLTDMASQVAIMGAMIIATANSAYTVNWKTPNGYVTLTAAQVITAANTIAEFIQHCFDCENALISQVANYTDPAAFCAAFDAAMAG